MQIVIQSIAYNLIWEFWGHGTTYDTKLLHVNKRV